MPPSSKNIFPWIGITHNLFFGLNDAICIFSITCRLNRQGGEFCLPPELILHPTGLVQYALHVLHIVHHIAICIYLQHLCPAFVVILQPTFSIPFSGFATSPQLSHLLDNIARHFTLDVHDGQWPPWMSSQSVFLAIAPSVHHPEVSVKRIRALVTREARGMKSE